jgi:hypothetical protein
MDYLKSFIATPEPAGKQSKSQPEPTVTDTVSGALTSFAGLVYSGSQQAYNMIATAYSGDSSTASSSSAPLTGQTKRPERQRETTRERPFSGASREKDAGRDRLGGRERPERERDGRSDRAAVRERERERSVPRERDPKRDKPSRERPVIRERVQSVDKKNVFSFWEQQAQEESLRDSRRERMSSGAR